MEAQLSRPTVFILEDDTNTAELMEQWVRSYFGTETAVYVQDTVNKGSMTLDTLQTVDLAILDRRLPDGKGEELLGTIGDRFDAITVMITGTSPDTDIIQLPIEDYVVKPIDEETFTKQLSLVAKLDAAGVLSQYSDARKASMLEWYLDEPAENPLFRRFAAKWTYDFLEVAHVRDRSYVYELYTNDGTSAATANQANAHVSVIGTLERDLQTLVEAGELEPVGEVFSTDDEYGWVKSETGEMTTTSADSIGIYRFESGLPERHVTELSQGEYGISPRELSRILESVFN